MIKYKTYTTSEPSTHFCECVCHLVSLHLHREKLKVIPCNNQAQDSYAKVQKIKLCGHGFTQTNETLSHSLSTHPIPTQVAEHSQVCSPDLRIQVMQKDSMKASNTEYPLYTFLKCHG